MSGDISACYNWRDAIETYEVEAAKHSVMHRRDPRTKNYLTQNVNSGE